MFFRRTKTANGLDGNSYYTYRLVENQREGTKIRQKTVPKCIRFWSSSFIRFRVRLTRLWSGLRPTRNFPPRVVVQ